MLRAYIEESNTILARQFNENHRYYSIHTDTEHGLFYIDSMFPRVYLKLEEIIDFNMEYVAEEVKEGFLSDKVTGNIYWRLKVNFPYVFKEEVLASGVKAPAKVKKGLLKNSVKYDNPNGMNEFLQYFVSAWKRESEAKMLRMCEELEQY